MNFKENLNLTKLPAHIAVIMDGNGRWAKKQGFLRAVGHNEGVKSVRDVVEGSAEIGVKYLTLYAFSTENWNRPKFEVDALMKILVSSLKKEIKTLQNNNIRLTAIGNIENLPKKAKRELLDVIDKTKDNSKMTLILALSYGSREEITSAFKILANKVQNGTLKPDEINDSLISENLYTKDVPDVDLMIRTSGEQRISNFLLWQMAYAELYFTSILWPDFRKENLYEAIYNYQNRERRFGKTSEQLS
ncbi:MULTISPECIES: isoprenyl transferase [unclassified Zunongwangia]|uniref:isoprenyl transferase n=1 Tax=unclassified Zunongwangia TaxID=2632541 RepID=UPI0022DE1421|nr:MULTISPECIES: isoprenyl transferase [unclassified Zunongwangia]WBL21984.1 isoprenyl transferase [Zunongwangia sp. HRR-M8]WBL26063.1 isoprenyl transferase [Zunongwangia sp. HGR-M22]